MLLGLYRQRSFEYEEVKLKNEALGLENDNGRKSGTVLADTNRSLPKPGPIRNVWLSNLCDPRASLLIG